MPRNFYWRKNKYNARPKEYGGRLYASTQEANDALWLDLLKSQGKIKEIEPQHRLFLTVNGKRITTHIVDFLITLPDGRQKFCETKGFATELFRIKYKLCQALYPDIPYLINPTDQELLR